METTWKYFWIPCSSLPSTTNHCLSFIGILSLRKESLALFFSYFMDFQKYKGPLQFSPVYISSFISTRLDTQTNSHIWGVGRSRVGFVFRLLFFPPQPLKSVSELCLLSLKCFLPSPPLNSQSPCISLTDLASFPFVRSLSLHNVSPLSKCHRLTFVPSKAVALIVMAQKQSHSTAKACRHMFLVEDGCQPHLSQRHYKVHLSGFEY